MSIVATDILFKLSTTAGAAGNANAQADPNASLGKYISTTQLSGTALNNAFDDISGAENAASTTDYRCVFIHNNHATLALQNAVVYLSGGDPAGGATVTIAVDNVAASVIGSASAQADIIANETTAPSAVGSFSAPSTIGTGLSIGTINAGSCRAIWVKRAATNSAAVSNEQITLAVTGDTL